MAKRIAFVVGAYSPEERARREKVALSYSTPEVQVGIVHTHVTPYVHDLTPAEISLVAPALMEASKEAERQGYDAVVPLGMLDLGVDGGRSVVDIPVIAPFQSTLFLGSILGDRLGLIAYHKVQYPNLEPIVRRYGMEHKVVGWANSGFDLPDIAQNHDEMVKNFVKVARRLVEEDRADVIIPTGISQCPVHIDPKWAMNQIGVPIVEGIGAPIRLEAMFADLGLSQSRARWPKSRAFEGK